MPPPLSPDVGDVATPDLIRCRHIKLSIQDIRNVRLLNRRSFVGMSSRLFADQLQFPHQASHLEPPDLLAVFLHHRHDAAATGSASTLRKQFVNPAAQPKPLNVWSSAPETVGVVTRTSDIKDSANPINRLVRAQLINQRLRSCSSDIKSAVAFFKMDFSRSSRAIRASNSWIFCCSGVSALLYGVTPVRSCCS